MSVQKAKNHLSVIMKIALTLQSPKNNLEGPRCTPGESLALTHSLLLPQLQQATPLLDLCCFLFHKENTTARKKPQQVPSTELLLYLFSCDHA